MIGIVVLTGLLAVGPFLLSPWIWPEYVYRHERFSGTALTDVNRLFIGYIPAGLGMPWWILVIAGVISLWLVMKKFGRSSVS